MLKIVSEFEMQFCLHGNASMFVCPLSYRLDEPGIGDRFLSRTRGLFPFHCVRTSFGDPPGPYPVESWALSQGKNDRGAKPTTSI